MKKKAIEIFEKLKPDYFTAYAHANGHEKAKLLIVEYKNGFVNIFTTLSDTIPTKVRLGKFESMIKTLSSRPPFMHKLTFTFEELKNSQQFKENIGDNVVSLIHNVYYDSRHLCPAYIVIHRNTPNTYSITRFFKTEFANGAIQVSADHQDIPDKEVFAVLLRDYSTGLK